MANTYTKIYIHTVLAVEKQNEFEAICPDRDKMFVAKLAILNQVLLGTTCL